MPQIAAPLPPPPTGYRPATHFRYPKLVLQVAAVVVLLITTPLLLMLTGFLQGGAGGIAFVANPRDLGLAVLTVCITVVVHELIHGLAYQLFGYHVTYGASLQLMAAYAGAFGQWQRRDHNIVVALAPLLVLTALLLPLLASSSPTLVLVGFTALLFNTGGAVGDLYLAGRLLRLPRAALLYDVDPQTMLIFLPAENKEQRTENKGPAADR
jgi:Putative zincin peptidase